MISTDGKQIFLKFGDGTLLLLRGVAINKVTKEKMRMLAIKDCSDDPQPLGEVEEKLDQPKKLTGDSAEIVCRFPTKESLDNLIEQLTKLRDSPIE